MSSLPRRLLILASGLAGAVPVCFGLIRAMTTRGQDVRYIWLAAAALAGSIACERFLPGSTTPQRVSVWRALASIAAGTICAAAAAFVLGASAGPGVAIVALGFGFCTGTSAELARVSSPVAP